MCDHSGETYWALLSPVVLVIMLYKVELVFKYMNEIPTERVWKTFLWEIFVGSGI